MSPTSRGSNVLVGKGFTLVEVLVAMTILVVVVILSMSVLFTMQQFSQRQQLYVEPRQTARRGVEYLSSYLMMSGSHVTNKNCGVVVWSAAYDEITPAMANSVQVSYNNVTNTAYADAGTDLVSVMLASDQADFYMQVRSFPSPGSGNPATVYVPFNKGCCAGACDDVNLSQFQSDCRCGNLGDLVYPSNRQVFFNDKAMAIAMQLRALSPSPKGLASDCQHAQVGLSWGSGVSFYNAPGLVPNLTAACPVCWVGAARFVSFRVKNNQLQQRNNLFDPAIPDGNPAATPPDPFFPLLDNVEDMQIAYIFDNGSIWNDSTAHRLPVPTSTDYTMSKFAVAPTGGVPLPPCSIGPNAGNDATYGVTHVQGIRLSLIARSTQALSAAEVKIGKFFPGKPAVEDGTSGASDRYFHHRLTATIMIRQQIAGS